MPNSFEGIEVYVGRLRVGGLVGRGIFSMPTVKLLIWSDNARESIELQLGNNGSIVPDAVGAVVSGNPWKPEHGICGATGKYIEGTGPAIGRGWNIGEQDPIVTICGKGKPVFVG